jgi:glycosyltransferase involved in cell wall biosynthesis
MTPFVAYDVTRLLRRYAVPSPNGIDRIDLAYARHFLSHPGAPNAGVYMHGLQPALLDRETLCTLLAEIEANWRVGQPDAAPQYENVRDWLLGRSLARPLMAPRETATRLRRFAPLRLLRPSGVSRGLFARMPADAVFLHTTHYPSGHLFRWLNRRRDVKPVFFIHDLLPLQFPEYFARGHIAEHHRAMEIFARYARAAIVNTHVVEDQVLRFLHSRNRRDVRVLVRPIPPEPVFAAPAPDPDLAGVAYFVMCGTIEPRKNHLTLLHVWRELSRQWGERTPKLVIVGRRGWENENVVDLLDRSHEIAKHVIEAESLSTAAVACLIAGARALLMPSFAEGYGLPIVEARAIGTPVIASDIPVFREIAPGATFCRPLDGTGWLAAIKTHAARMAPPPVSPEPKGGHEPLGDYFAAIEAFLGGL